MRSIFTSFACLILLCNAVHAQVTDSIVTYNWQTNNGSQYVYAGQENHHYDSQCKLDTVLFGAYVNSTFQNSLLLSFVYTSYGYQQLQQNWQNAWQNQYRFTTYINAFGGRDSFVTEQWTNNNWLRTTGEFYSYNSNHLILSDTTKYWDAVNGWRYTYRKDYLYNNNNTAVRYLRYQYQSQSIGWTPYTKDTLIYTSFNKIQSDSTQNWSGNSWVNAFLSNDYYDSLNRISGYLAQSWTGFPTPSFVNNSRAFYSYTDTSRFITQREYQNWYNDAWANTSKSVYSYKNCSSVLPLLLVGFTAMYHNPMVSLHWQTANEINVSSFAIQRSVDGVHFSTIGHTAASGGNGTTVSYIYNDNLTNLAAGRVYYRLLIENNDGTTQMSEVKFVDNETAFAMSINPNPVTGNSCKLSLYNVVSSIINVSIYDLQGRKMFAQEFTAAPGTMSKTIEVGKLLPGLYLLHVKTGAAIQTLKLLKE